MTVHTLKITYDPNGGVVLSVMADIVERGLLTIGGHEEAYERKTRATLSPEHIHDLDILEAVARNFVNDIEERAANEAAAVRSIEKK